MQFELNDYKIKLYSSDEASTLVIMHEDHDEGGEVWELLPDRVRESITLACISGNIWESDFSPWEAKPLFKKAPPFTGGADDYLVKLVDVIIPEIVDKTGKLYDKVYIAGYSLAGLFATYLAIKSDVFDGFVSASGSMWYPNFLDFVKNNAISSKIRRGYLSVGDREAKTKNQLMQTVEDNTIEVERLVEAQGVQTKFELNQGGHFTEDALRLAKGIAWCVEGI